MFFGKEGGNFNSIDYDNDNDDNYDSDDNDNKGYEDCYHLRPYIPYSVQVYNVFTTFCFRSPTKDCKCPKAKGREVEKRKLSITGRLVAVSCPGAFEELRV